MTTQIAQRCIGALILSALAAFLLASCSQSTEGPVSATSPVVEIEQGKVEGAKEGELNVFKGIPYAAPPVGEQRWTPPQPPESWDGIREATAFGPSCVQPELPKDSIYYDPPA